MTQVWPTIERFIAEQGAAVLVTLVACEGSSPREAGAHMVVRRDGAFSGTIGGGALEWNALAEARAMMERGETFRTLDMALGPDLGQCCGGRVVATLEHYDARDAALVAPLAQAERKGPIVTMAAPAQGRPARTLETRGALTGEPRTVLADGRVIERFGTAPMPLYLFGAGHVGRSLALALAPLPFAVTWCDPRPDAFPAHIPANVTCRHDPDVAGILTQAPRTAFIVVMTHSHPLDLDIVARALRPPVGTGAAATPFPYVGLIGSDTKRARFVSMLRKLDVSNDAIDRLVCPIGLVEITDKAPAAIAASVAAQLLIVRDRVAAQTGEQVVSSPPIGAHHG